jgi:hypothetical protein
MSSYHWAAVFPALIAVVCVVIAWRVLHQSQHVPAEMPLESMRAPRPRATPHPPVPRFSDRLATQSLFSDRLGVPSPPTRATHHSACELQKGTRIWKLNFSSACRDDAWPSTSVWRVDLPTVMRNVSSVSLRSVGLHASEYTVDAWNNTIDVAFGGNTYAVVVPIGMYTASALATAVTAAFVATDVALAAFTATYTALTDTITIAEGTPAAFTLLWVSGTNANTSLARTLGYTTDTSSTLVGVSHVAAAPGRVDLDGVLAIDVFADELTNSMDGPIGRVMLEREPDAPVFQQTPLEEVHTFWPIGRLQFLTFRFMVQYGRVEAGVVTCDYRPYEFHGKNNTLRLDFGETSYINPMEKEVQLDPGT